MSGPRIKVTKSAYLVAVGVNRNLVLEQRVTKCADYYKYLGVTDTTGSSSETANKIPIKQKKQATRYLHGVLWRTQIRQD